MLSEGEYLSESSILCFLGEGSLKLSIHEKQRWIPHCASWAVINFLPSFWKKKEPRTFETFGQNAQERNRGNLKSSRMFFSAPWVHPRPSFSFLGVVSPIFSEGWNIHFLMVGRLISFLGNRFFFSGATVDGRNPAPVDMVNIPIIYKVLYIAGGAGFLPSTVC